MKRLIVVILLLVFFATASVFVYKQYVGKKVDITTDEVVNNDAKREKIVETNAPEPAVEENIETNVSLAVPLTNSPPAEELVADAGTNMIEDVEPAVTNEFISAASQTNLPKRIESAAAAAETNIVEEAKEIIETNISEKVDVKAEWKEPKVELEMSAEDEYIAQANLPTVKTVEVFKASLQGLKRGGINLVTFPGELARGFTYEYSAKKWYVALGTSWLSALGGTGARLGAGFADLATLGIFGDMEYAPGFPDYVWQGPWLYKPPRAVPTKATSNLSVPTVEPDTDVAPSVNAKVIKTRAQENIDFYQKKLPENAY